MEHTSKAQLRRNFLLALVILQLGFACEAVHADMPDYYSEPGFNANRDYPQLNQYETVDPFTGKLQLHHTDILIKGNGGMDLAVTRSYTASSNWANVWTMHVGGKVIINPNYGPCPSGYISNMYNPVLELPDGSMQVLSNADTPGFISTNMWKASCDASGAFPFLNITSPAGTVYRMNYPGNNNDYYPTLITDRNGNWIQVAYQSKYANGAQITSITTSEGTTLTFNYTPTYYPPSLGGGLSGYANLTSITTSATPGCGGIWTSGSPPACPTWTYSYIAGYAVGADLLSQVTLPDGTTWQYGYNGNLGANTAGSYQINSVTNPMRGVSTFTYGFSPFYASSSGLVVTSRTISGFNGSCGGQTVSSGAPTWTYAYTPSTGLGVLDSTTITDPLGQTETYKHFGYSTAAQFGDVWKIGLLMQKITGPAAAPVRTETYTWTPMYLSAQNNTRNFAYTGDLDTEFYSPLLASKTITQDGATYTTSYTYPTSTNPADPFPSNYIYSYGNANRIDETGPNGGSRTTNLTYYVNTAKWILHTTQNETVTGGVAISRTFDANNNMLTFTRDGVTTSYTCDTQGNVASVTYPRSGRVYNYSGYTHGIAQTESQPENITITRTVDPWGNVLSQTNGNGYTTRYTYDGLNRLTSTAYPAGNSLAIAYSPTTKTTTRGALTETVNYNGFGLPTDVNLGGITQSYGYDALQRRTCTSNPGSTTVATSFAYDQLNRVTTVTSADNSVKRTSYGAGSTTVTDERGNATTYAYRSYGDPDKKFLMSITAPVAAANISIARNGHDQITSVTQNGFTRTYGYNANFYLSSVVNPETGTTTYGRDAEGNMTSRAVGTSGTTTYAYDLQNRLVSTSYPGMATAVTQTYTKTSKLASVTSAAATRSYAYDPNDNLTSESMAIDGITLAAGYGYNANDQLSSLTYPYLGRTVSFTPDALGRPTTVGSYVSNVAYWPSGQINQISYVNGTVTTYAQDVRLRPSSFVTQLGAAAPYVNSAYSYDAAGNVTNIADTANPNFARTFAYDPINRLITANGPWGTGSISYDGGGNILSQSYGATSSTYAYSATTNLLSSITGTLRTATYAYDSSGDIVADGNGKTFTYDGVPNLTSFSDTVSGTAITHAYDGLNKRVKVVKNGVATYEFYGADGKLLAEYTPSQTNKLLEYFYLGNKRIAQRLSNQ